MNAGTGAPLGLRLRLLADFPALVPVVAAWQHEEWGHLTSGDSVERRMEKLRDHLDQPGVPLTFVAMVESRAVGSADLVPEELPDHADLSPWLSCVYVLPDYRGRGIGTALTRAVERKAGAMGYSSLYLCTWTAGDFYRRLGWRTLRDFTREGADVEIMVRRPG